MGFLAQAGQGIGAFAAGGDASAGGLATRSLQAGTLATGLNITGDLLEGIGGYQQAHYAASVARQNADAALQAGQYEESASKMRYGALEARQLAGQAASGVQVNSGSSVAVRHSTEEVGALDALAIRFNAARQAYAERTQAGLDEMAGRGALGAGLLKAGTSFLSGATSLGDKWLAFRRTGAMATPASSPGLGG